jgi:hypothetical protein
VVVALGVIASDVPTAIVEEIEMLETVSQWFAHACEFF